MLFKNQGHRAQILSWLFWCSLTCISNSHNETELLKEKKEENKSVKGHYILSVVVKVLHAAISCNTALLHTSNHIRTKLKPGSNYSFFLSGTLYSQISKHFAI